MSNRYHLLAENDINKRSIKELLGAPQLGAYVDVDIDDIEYLVHFERPYRNEEKIEHIFSNVIRCPYGHKVVRQITNPREPGQPLVLIPINDTLSITGRVEEVLKKVIFRNVETGGLDDVRAYLLQHIDLIDILPFVSRIASEAFNLEAELTLQLYRDPEVEDSYLAFFARTRQYDGEFFEKISRIRSGYTDLMTGKSGWILVTTDYDTPIRDQ